ncbi:MAG: tRNA pseudouridine(55) synthase TruB [Solirubrobacterales bacterium]|nr:tRNA pseudouridine(55) synthase TruB [Solirubrobacterales bacterium]
MTALPAIRLVDKPVGITSHDVVGRIRREYPKNTRVGHAGTLDPFASGLLLILIGRATRTQRFFMGLDKEYFVTAQFGATSSTGDPEGEITPTGNIPEGDLVLPIGPQDQIPPKYSALKVDGKRAYSLARAGEDFTLESRRIEVTSFEEVERGESTRDYRIRCSSGTYIRSLIGDLGDAYCTSLRRTEIGPFALPKGGDETLSLESALKLVMPEVAVTEDQARLLGHGQKFEVAGVPESTVVAQGPQGLVAIASVDADGVMSSLVGFVG